MVSYMSFLPEPTNKCDAWPNANDDIGAGIEKVLEIVYIVEVEISEDPDALFLTARACFRRLPSA